jgi:hypothetical protein
LGAPTVADGVPLFLQVAVVLGETLDLGLPNRMMTETLVSFSLHGGIVLEHLFTGGAKR